MAALSAVSSSAVQRRSSSNTRFAMLAAAALVKVMQRIFAGSTPSSSRRITRCASTWVLPEPALAATQAETAGIRGLHLQAPQVIGNDATSAGIDPQLIHSPLSASSGPATDHSFTRARWS